MSNTPLGNSAHLYFNPTRPFFFFDEVSRFILIPLDLLYSMTMLDKKDQRFSRRNTDELSLHGKDNHSSSFSILFLLNRVVGGGIRTAIDSVSKAAHIIQK